MTRATLSVKNTRTRLVHNEGRELRDGEHRAVAVYKGSDTHRVSLWCVETLLLDRRIRVSLCLYIFLARNRHANGKKTFVRISLAPCVSVREGSW